MYNVMHNDVQCTIYIYLYLFSLMYIMMYSYISSLWIASDRSFFSMLTQLNRVETQRLIPWWYQWFCPGGIGGFRMIPSWELTFPIKKLLLSWIFQTSRLVKSPLVIVNRMKVSNHHILYEWYVCYQICGLVDLRLHGWGQKTCCSILKKSSASRSDHELTLLSVSWCDNGQMDEVCMLLKIRSLFSTPRNHIKLYPVFD